MALNIPMPESPGSSLLQGLDTGSNMMSRIMQPIIERERLKQQADQFAQNYVLQKQAQGRAQTLLPYMIQQYQDTHKTAANEADIKSMYLNLLRGALNPQEDQNSPVAAPPPPPMPAQMGEAQPNAAQGGMTPLSFNPQGQPLAGQPTPDNQPPPGAAPASAPPALPMAANGEDVQEHELRAGNPRLSRLDSVAGLVPGIPKPVTHMANGMVFTTYPSGRMTVQKVPGAQTPGQATVTAKEASKIRDQATALINSANLVQQGYDLLDSNSDLTGLGSGAAQMLNLSNNPDLGKFTTVTGKLQAELGKYAASRGGIQAVKWAGSVKPSAWKPEDYNYGMFEGIQRNLKDDYNTLNQQYKAATGQDLPVALPNMASSRAGKPAQPPKVKKVWKLVNGELV